MTWIKEHMHLMETLACLALILIGLPLLGNHPQLAAGFFIAVNLLL